MKNKVILPILLMACFTGCSSTESNEIQYEDYYYVAEVAEEVDEIIEVNSLIEENLYRNIPAYDSVHVVNDYHKEEYTEVSEFLFENNDWYLIDNEESKVKVFMPKSEFIRFDEEEQLLKYKDVPIEIIDGCISMDTCKEIVGDSENYTLTILNELYNEVDLVELHTKIVEFREDDEDKCSVSLNLYEVDIALRMNCDEDYRTVIELREQMIFDSRDGEQEDEIEP